ncbi:TetR/AcrR family transcriptional regulator, partial [Bacillus thuringiensis]|uniref:TetR/AcrR family transcriptional regulator n=1 Tax=Bacillus thuringiensis TaxID=1428 RepID=UPI00119ED531
WDLYCQKKIEKISIKEITDNAGYYRSTFYEYFTDIYDILEQLETELILYITESIQESLQSPHNEDIIQKIAILYEDKGEYLSVLLGNNGDPNFIQKFKKTLRPALFKSFHLSENNEYTKLIFEFSISGILSSIKYWYDNKKTIPADEIVIMIRSILLNGTTKQIQKYNNDKLGNFPFTI